MQQVVLPGRRETQDARSRLVLLRERLLHSRYSTETVFGDSVEAAKVIERLRKVSREILKVKKEILAIGLVGSRVNGIARGASDIDLIIVADHISNARPDTFFGFLLRDPQINYEYVLDGLHVHFDYHRCFMQSGVYDLPEYLTFTELRRFLLAAKLEYFTAMETALWGIGKEEMRDVQGYFAGTVLQVYDGIVVPYAVQKLARKSGLTEDEVKKVFDAEYCRLRALHGILGKEQEMELLRADRTALGEFLV